MAKYRTRLLNYNRAQTSPGRNLKHTDSQTQRLSDCNKLSMFIYIILYRYLICYNPCRCIRRNVFNHLHYIAFINYRHPTAGFNEALASLGTPNRLCRPTKRTRRYERRTLSCHPQRVLLYHSYLHCDRQASPNFGRPSLSPGFAADAHQSSGSVRNSHIRS